MTPTAEPTPWFVPADIPNIEANVYCHNQDKWTTISLPNREGPTQGRQVSTIVQLKKEALIAFGYENLDRATIRDVVKMYYNNAGQGRLPVLPNNKRVIHRKWYSMTVMPGDDARTMRAAP
eukprot:2586954-Pyramimonas_sp.AAC.1